MRPIKSINRSDEVFKLEELWSSCILPEVNMFFTENQFDKNENDSYIITNPLLTAFKDSISHSLERFLDTTYSEPTINQLQKHSTRFERFVFAGKKYNVNIAMSENGRVAFALFSILEFIDDAISENRALNINF